MTLQKLTQPARLARTVMALASLFGMGLVLPGLAHAELKLCNSTSSRIGVAIGYKDKDGWASEGWWNVDSQSCAQLINDKLRARFYYVYAFDYDKGGEWGGPIPMCTNDVEFTIKGIDNCDGRGFKKSGFFEVDTQEQTDWTVKLTDQGEPAPPPVENAGASPAGAQPAPAQAAAVAGPGTKKR
jgi:uncharacterized membrane protein